MRVCLSNPFGSATLKALHWVSVPFRDFQSFSSVAYRSCLHQERHLSKRHCISTSFTGRLVAPLFGTEASCSSVQRHREGYLSCCQSQASLRALTAFRPSRSRAIGRPQPRQHAACVASHDALQSVSGTDSSALPESPSASYNPFE